MKVKRVLAWLLLLIGIGILGVSFYVIFWNISSGYGVNLLNVQIAWRILLPIVIGLACIVGAYRLIRKKIVA